MIQRLLISFFLLLSLQGWGQEVDTVQILPGRGIIINSDSVLLGDKNYLNLAKKLHTKVPPDLSIMYNGDCITTDMQFVYPMSREVDYDSINFIYQSCGDSINMSLSNIFIGNSPHLYSYITNDINIGGSDTAILKTFKKSIYDGISNSSTEKRYIYYSLGVILFSVNSNINSIWVFNRRKDD